MALSDAQTIRIAAAAAVADSGKTYTTVNDMITDIVTMATYLTDGTTP